MQPEIEGFRLSPQQRRVWKLQQDITGGSSAFVSRLVLSLEGELRLEVVREALEKVCARHEALRTVFRRLPGVVMPVQVVQDQTLISWDATDLDPENGPLVSAILTTLAPDRHLLSITVPALCADRRTLSNLASALFGNAESEDETLQYIQFSEWQNSLEEDDDAEKGREYWARKDLSNVAALLPGQQARQRARTEIPRELQVVKLNFTPEYAACIEALATKHDATSATVLLAAWQTLLWRLTQQTVAVGNVTEGRSYELLQDGFGLFARVLPVCCPFTDDLRFGEVISEIDHFQRESEEWQDYFSFDESATSPLSYFAFAFECVQIPLPWQAGGLRISVDRQDSFVEPFDLKLTVVLKTGETGGIEATFEYNDVRFDEAYVKFIAEQFQTLLDSALANPESPISELEIVSAAQRQQIVVEWNKTNRDYKLDHTLHELFEQQVARTPDALAAVFQNEQLTFAELNRRGNQLANYLKTEGVTSETAVGICIEPSLEMLIAALGILKAGGAYVPLDPRNPQQRIDQVLKDAGASILLTREVVLNARTEGGDNFQTETAAENLAYIIYTSGSTGTPKGVMIQHRSVVNLAAALHEQVYAGLGPALKVGLSAPLAFDASVKQLVQLLHGHTLHILPEELRLDAKGALHYIAHHDLDVLDCTPSQLKLLLAAGLTQSSAPKLMLVGGEAIDESTWTRLAEDQRTRFFNVYGPTECTVDATWAQVTHGQPTIGHAIPNAQTYILDQNLKPTGVHLSGELLIGGTGLARGYLNSPERTAGRFIPDDLSGSEGARLYRTGDLARYAADGSIIFTGRNDAQVKVRGHRIELGEIESVLLKHKIKQAVVIAREAANADIRLVAYVVTTDNSTLDTSELRQKLSEQLPDYMVPSFLVTLEELPLTRNGKVDLNALPAPETAQRSRDENYVAPRNEIEATITRVWQEALGVDRIGVNDNFFDAGGHSLLMVQVHNKLSDRFDKKISIVEMFAKPTISALAEYFSDTNGHKPTFEKVMHRAARRRQAVSMRQ
ncbi:MAG TPA: amino acid adenylation domain-containing protein [Pyrinomonadaceae bacterium]|nr:amino acid adenylation domain-containing protein [Pyrinomonadaceae bacterium]